ncbi:MAG: DUF4258 domain-containing protein [Pseudodesulfovibrio sp.]|nr:DUF4258 domain-containing protein [Pseudodesulfovibrio sp.]
MVEAKEENINVEMTVHAQHRMTERNISAATTLACIQNGEAIPGYWNATKYYLLGYTAVTQQCGKKLKVLTVYEGRPTNIVRRKEPRPGNRDPAVHVFSMVEIFHQALRRLGWAKSLSTSRNTTG